MGCRLGRRTVWREICGFRDRVPIARLTGPVERTAPQAPIVFVPWDAKATEGHYRPQAPQGSHGPAVALSRFTGPLVGFARSRAIRATSGGHFLTRLLSTSTNRPIGGGFHPGSAPQAPHEPHQAVRWGAMAQPSPLAKARLDRLHGVSHAGRVWHGHTLGGWLLGTHGHHWRRRGLRGH